jgi:DNA-binding CsgD family transcriptional regulator
LAAAARSMKLSQEDAVTALMELVESTGNADSLVSAFLARPEFMRTALQGPARSVIPRIVARSRNPRLLREIPADARVAAMAQRSPLTPREREVHALVVGGLTNREIAKALFVSEPTVKVHVRNIYDKLGVRSRVALALQESRDQI